jgi:hypothetical protein
MTEQIKQEMTVQWIVNRKDKKLIKFVEGEDKTYKIADNLNVDEIVKRKTNIPVNVTIENDTVTSISIRGEETKPESPKEEKPIETPKQETIEKKPEPVQEQKEVIKEESKNTQSSNTYKVKGYSKDMLWWLFEETGEKVWFGVDDKLIDFMKTIKKGDVLEINGESRKSRGKDVDFITSAKLITQSKAIENTSSEKEQPKKASYRDESAMDKRTAVMVAKDIVVALINSKSERVNSEEKVNILIKNLTKVCYESLITL